MRGPTLIEKLHTLWLPTLAGVVAAVSFTRLAAPFPLAIEDAILRTVLLVRAGVNVYSPDTYAQPPFNVMLYTPAFAYLTASLPLDPANRYFAPRLFAMSFMLAAPLFLFCTRRDGFWYGLLASGTFFFASPVVQNTAFVKNDSMALFFAAAAVAVASRSASDRGVRATLAALLCFASIATKQSYIAAPLACAGHLWLKDGALFRRFLGTLCVSSILGAALAQAYWGAGFWWSVFVAPRNHFVWTNYILYLQRVFAQWAVVFVFALAGVVWTLDVRSKGFGAFEESPLPLYVVTSLLTLIASLGRFGADTNYFFEALLALLMYLCMKSEPLGGRAPRGAWILAGVVFAGCFARDLAVSERWQFAFTTAATNAEYARALELSAAELDSIPAANDRVLAFGAHDFPLSRGRDLSLNDIAAYSVMWSEGKLPLEDMLTTIRRHHFGVIILPKPRSLSQVDRIEPLRVLFRVIHEEYEVALHGTHYDYLVPATPPGPLPQPLI